MSDNFNYWIAQTLRTEREGLERTKDDIAMHIPGARGNRHADDRTISRIEAGKSWQNIEDHVTAYAYILGLEDARDLWQAALERWWREGAPPQFEPIEGPAAAFAQAAHDQGLRDRARVEAQLHRRRASDKSEARRAIR